MVERVMKFSADEIEFYRQETHGTPEFISKHCGCRARLKGERVRIKPCSFDCVPWIARVGLEVVADKKQRRDRAFPPESYRDVLDGYLEWGNGMTLSFGCTIGSYGHGKASREWHVKEWKEGIQNGWFVAEEFLGSLGCNGDNFKSIFGRDYQNETVRSLSEIEFGGRGVRAQ